VLLGLVRHRSRCSAADNATTPRRLVLECAKKVVQQTVRFPKIGREFALGVGVLPAVTPRVSIPVHSLVETGELVRHFQVSSVEYGVKVARRGVPA